MARRQHVPVRIGPISLFTLIAVLCLAVMAVLTVTTSNAMVAMTQRQATSTTEGYVTEVAGQHFVAGVDALLAPVRAQGADQASATSAVNGGLASLMSAAKADGVTAEAQVSGNNVIATFVSENGRRLDVTLSIGQDAKYTITSWKLTTVQNDEGSAETLWSGTSNKD